MIDLKRGKMWAICGITAALLATTGAVCVVAEPQTEAGKMPVVHKLGPILTVQTRDGQSHLVYTVAGKPGEMAIVYKSNGTNTEQDNNKLKAEAEAKAHGKPAPGSQRSGQPVPGGSAAQELAAKRKAEADAKGK